MRSDSTSCRAAQTRRAIHDLIGIGVTHLVLGAHERPAEGTARWLVDEIITPVLEEAREVPAG